MDSSKEEAETIQEWIELIREARELGLSIDEIREFFNRKTIST